MPIINCPDCGKDISDAAATCIHCGRPMSKQPYGSESAKASNGQTSTSACSCSGCFVVAVGFYLILALFGSGSRQTPANQINRPLTIQQSKTGTITGYDSATKTIIDPIIVYKDYENRNLGLACKVRHGEKVTILEEMGTGTPHGVKIRTDSGATGWVSNWFVKEDQ